MGSFIGRRGDWKMVQLSGLEAKICGINQGRRPAMALYLYGDPAYSTVYGIMEPYKNFPNRPRTPAHNHFNKAMAKLRIEVEHGFALHQNLWTWNGFHLGLKLRQGAAVCYAVSVLLANIWTCMKGNQTSTRFGCMPPAVEEYLALLADADFIGTSSSEEGIELEDKEEEEKVEEEVENAAEEDGMES